MAGTPLGLAEAQRLCVLLPWEQLGHILSPSPPCMLRTPAHSVPPEASTSKGRGKALEKKGQDPARTMWAAQSHRHTAKQAKSPSSGAPPARWAEPMKESLMPAETEGREELREVQIRRRRGTSRSNDQDMELCGKEDPEKKTWRHLK